MRAIACDTDSKSRGVFVSSRCNFCSIGSLNSWTNAGARNATTLSRSWLAQHSRRSDGLVPKNDAIQRQRGSHRHRTGDHLLQKAPGVREPHHLGDGVGWIVGLDLEMSTSFGAAGLDVAALHRAGQVEVELSAAARRL